MKKAYKWIAGIASAIVAVLLFFAYRKYKDGEVDTLKDALVVERATTEIKVLDAKREALEQDIGDRDEEIAIVKDELVANKKTIVEARTKAKGLTDEGAILAEYRKLGYL